MHWSPLNTFETLAVREAWKCRACRYLDIEGGEGRVGGGAGV